MVTFWMGLWCGHAPSRVVKVWRLSYGVQCPQTLLSIDTVDALHILYEEDYIMISKELLDILACPECKGEIVYDEPNQRLICHHCKKAYPVREGIPVMLAEEAEMV